ncbi:MAG: type II toxin-antitoxin system VapC family toxin [Betaproteobacteria bacterium]|nr:type II toxin-antitoxin system VapC family toxin [Betaproteobacteria bacterium]
MNAYLDTHVALWLYSGQTERISKRAANLINKERIGVSPVVLLELQYLQEIGRVTATPRTIIADLKRRLGLAVEDRSMETIAERALALNWTRDVFDRLIVAQAALDNGELITTDRLILKHYPKAVW